MTQFTVYQSPFSFRYGSNEMRYIWSEVYKRKLWRKIWVSLAEVQSQFGLVSAEQAADLCSHVDDIDIERALEIEAEIHHDLMAEVKTYAEQCRVGGGIIHLGATSMDIEDNADAIRLKESLTLIRTGLHNFLILLANRIEEWASIPVMGFTHLQPAEPVTLGYRFAFYAQDLLADWHMIDLACRDTKGKGFKGAVGSAASYQELIGKTNLEAFEAALSQKLSLGFFAVSGQTYPRKQDYRVVSALAGLAASLYKLAFDLRFLQSPPVGELSEPFAEKQVGSSAMPFKRNPINAEKIDSLARSLAQMPQIAWQNAANSLLERTLDDSANRRTLLPESFLTADELLRTTTRIIAGLNIRHEAIQANMQRYAPFSATERLMMELAKAGADRQEMHELIRTHSLAAWEIIRSGQPNDLLERVSREEKFLQYIPLEQIQSAMNAEDYTGASAEWALRFAAQIRHDLG